MYLDPVSNQPVKQDKKKYNTLDDAIEAAKDINKKGQNIHKAVVINVLFVLNIALVVKKPSEKVLVVSFNNNSY